MLLKPIKKICEESQRRLLKIVADLETDLKSFQNIGFEVIHRN
jgi:hypothetical protein